MGVCLARGPPKSSWAALPAGPHMRHWWGVTCPESACRPPQQSASCPAQPCCRPCQGLSPQIRQLVPRGAPHLDLKDGVQDGALVGGVLAGGARGARRKGGGCAAGKLADLPGVAGGQAGPGSVEGSGEGIGKLHTHMRVGGAPDGHWRARTARWDCCMLLPEHPTAAALRWRQPSTQSRRELAPCPSGRAADEPHLLVQVRV